MPFSMLLKRLRRGGGVTEDTHEEYCAEAVVSRLGWRWVQYTLAATLVTIALVTIALASRPDVPREAPLWSDEFDALSAAWMIDPNNTFIANGQMLLNPALLNTPAIAIHRLSVADFVAETHASAQGATDNAYGLVAANADNLIAFLISSDGYTSVMQRSKGRWRELRTWRQWPHVHRGDASNLLRLMCVDTTCRFYVNGEITAQIEIATQRDAIGLIASRYANEVVAVGFESLRVWAAPS